MRQKSSILIGSLALAGLLSGYSAKRLMEPPPTGAVGQNPLNERARSKATQTAVISTPVRELASFPSARSKETLETLTALGDDELYGKLAKWLADASEPEIAAFWSVYSKKPKRSNDITDLIFLNWTRLDPQAAIAGSSSDQHAWWAWACHDPAGALAAANANAPDHVNHVAWGIGEFHPEWLRAHFKELSKGAQDNALRGLSKWDDGQDPLAAMKFLVEVNRRITPGTFKALIRQDPWAAVDWLKDHPKSVTNSFDYNIQDPMKFLIKTMAEERPEDLERLAEQTPSGSNKLAMESALFANLLATDPAAAMERAKSTTAPRVAAERYAAIGLGILKADPERAFEVVRSLFVACPNAMQMYSMVEYPNGASGSGVTIPGVQEFVDSLVAKDPERILNMTSAIEAARNGSSPFQSICNQWATRDLVGYTNWVNRQTDPDIREQGARIVISSLQQQGNHAEAADWHLTTSAAKEPEGIRYFLGEWKRSDPAGASEWLEGSNLPEEQKVRIRASLDKPE